MINVSEVVNAPELAQDFQIERSTGSFVYGKWVSVTTIIDAFGVISVADSRDVDMIPEGDRIVGAMVFHSECPIYGTRDKPGEGGSSDILIWRGQRFRVIQDAEYVDYGYYRAIARRLNLA